jgi:hypothetical protein
MTVKTKRALISIAGIEVEAFQLPAGDYVMSQSQGAHAINSEASNILRFLQSDEIKPLPGKRLINCTLAVKVPRNQLTSYQLKLCLCSGHDKLLREIQKCKRLSI